MGNDIMNKNVKDGWCTEATLSLLKTKGIGRGTVHSFLGIIQDKSHNFTFPSNLDDLNDAVIRIENIAKREKKPYKLPKGFVLESGNRIAKEIINKSEKLDIQIINWYSDLFPDSLKKIPDPPVLLYGKGKLDLLKVSNAIAVIGTRNPSEYGYTISHRLGYVLAKNGFTIIGGLAKGCDIAAHKGCLDAEGNTIAVLAHGLDSIYPRENENTAKRIVSSNGCLLSEYEPGNKSVRHQFVDRDRLQSGLSKAVIVVETGKTGGTMHTATFALKQEKNLAVVHFPMDRASIEQQEGYNRLIYEFRAKSVCAENDEELDQFIFKIKQSVNPKCEGVNNQSSILNW